MLINELAAYRKCWSASWRVGIPVFPIDPKSRQRPRHRKHIFAFDVEACHAATWVLINISCHPFVLRALPGICPLDCTPIRDDRAGSTATVFRCQSVPQSKQWHASCSRIQCQSVPGETIGNCAKISVSNQSQCHCSLCRAAHRHLLCRCVRVDGAARRFAGASCGLIGQKVHFASPFCLRFFLKTLVRFSRV